ncbi:MAG: hypothetical protein P8N19_13065 [Flavobacteriales bacterium]|nr:hypothetical protein [Flavobacteriales bacterium]MDG1766369.1 hypothetical protein [Flavobacteriales bacterium]
MKHLLVFLFSFGLSAAVFGQYSAFRELYLIELEKEKCLELFEITKEKKDPLMMAYHGASLAMLADFGFNPVKKMEQFNTGSELITIAIELDPKNIEIRLIRLSIQLEAPDFLGFNCCVNQDLSAVKNALKNNWLSSDSNYKMKIMSFFEHRGITLY